MSSRAANNESLDQTVQDHNFGSIQAARIHHLGYIVCKIQMTAYEFSYSMSQMIFDHFLCSLTAQRTIYKSWHNIATIT